MMTMMMTTTMMMTSEPGNNRCSVRYDFFFVKLSCFSSPVAYPSHECITSARRGFVSSIKHFNGAMKPALPWYPSKFDTRYVCNTMYSSGMAGGQRKTFMEYSSTPYVLSQVQVVLGVSPLHALCICFEDDTTMHTP